MAEYSDSVSDVDSIVSQEHGFRPRFRKPINIEQLLTTGMSFEIDCDDNEAEFFTVDDVADENVTELSRVQMQERKNSKVKSIFSGVTFEDVGGDYKGLADKMENVNANGGVKKLVIQEGQGQKIPEGSRVYMHYVVVSEGCDEPFDSTLARGRPEIVQLKTDDLLPGLFIAVGSMKVEEISKFLVTSDYAYGDYGCPPRIPPKSRLLYIIEIVDITPPEKLTSILHKTYEERGVMSFSVICEEAIKLRLEGNAFYTQSQYSQAVRRYHNGLKILEDYPVVKEEDEVERNKLLFSFYINMAQAYLKLDKAPQACVASKNALRLEYPNNPILYKAYLRFASAKYKLGSYKDARDLCIKALKYEPDNKGIQNLLAKAQKRIQEDEALLNRMYTSMSSDFRSANVSSNLNSVANNSTEVLESTSDAANANPLN